MQNVPIRTVFGEITDFLATNPTPEEIVAYELPEDLQARAHELLDKNGEGELTPEEQRLRRLDPKAFRRRFANRVRFSLDNETIERNLVRARTSRSGALRPTLNMPFLRSNRTYYFAVSAIYYTPDGIAIQSDLSREVFAVLRRRAHFRAAP